MLRLSLFGGFRAAGADGGELAITSRKARGLLAYLALSPGRSRSREALMALLWSERGEAQARASLRQALVGLRRELGAAAAALIVTKDAVALDADKVAVEAAGGGAELLAGLHIRDPAFEEWLRDERLRREEGGPAEGPTGPPARAGKPAVAVLPFANLSADPEQQYFSDGLTEDIMTELSRFGSLDVVARNSTFVYRDQAVDVLEIARKVGARYLLEGSLRKSGRRIRLTAQLIDARSGTHVWADRYDRELADIFEVQDELVRAIVSSLAVRLTAADTARSLRKPAESPAAYDLYLQGLSLDRLYDAESARRARELARRAVALDPGFARAHALLASQIFTCGWFDGRPAERYTDEALGAAAQSVALDPDDSFCTATLGTVHLLRRDHEQARHFFETALRSNPHDSGVWADYAWYLMSVGRPEAALERLDSKEIFEPHPPNWHWEIRGQVLYLLGRYGEARTVLERMTVKPFWVKGFLAACCGQLGEVEAARRYWAEARAAGVGLSATYVSQMACYRDEADSRHWAEGLRKAGLST